MKINLLLFVILISGCAVVSTADYIHDDTRKLRRQMNWWIGEVKLDEDLTFVPDFGRFPSKWGPDRRAYLWIVSRAPSTVFINTVKLIASAENRERTYNFSENISVTKIYKRQTTLIERLGTGGFFKGDRVIETDTFYTNVPLFTPAPNFRDDPDYLVLEIDASINDGPLVTYRYDLQFKEKVMLDFISR